MSGKARSPGASALRFGCLLAEPFYAGGAWLRNRCFDLGLLKAQRLPVPVICVGNITTGGTGKTPVVKWLAGTLRALGHHPAILTRGYSKGGDSDEAQLLASVAPVFQGANRFDVGTSALQSRPETDCFILDDGFQHRKLHRDLDIVLVDATCPFGFDHVLPRGMLREPLGGLHRADAFLITRIDQASRPALDRMAGVLPARPTFRCRHRAGVPDAVRTRPAFAFCGIGNPESFFDALRRLDLQLAGTRAFPDHHPYTARELNELPQDAVLLTTEKDWMRIKGLSGLTREIHVTTLEIVFEAGDEPKLLEMVRKLLPVR